MVRTGDDAESWASDAAGTPEGDGDFESDGLPSTGETSAGGQVATGDEPRAGIQGREQHHRGVREAIDEVITGKIQP